VLGGDGIAVDDLVRVARGGAPVELGPAARERLAAGRAALDAALAGGAAVYGASRGLGPRAGESTAVGEAGRERAVLLGRSAGVGPSLPAEVVRAALCARLAGLALGTAGASPGVAEALAALLREGRTPPVPSIGSVGVSDLLLLAHAALPLADDVDLAPKDALSLIGTNALAVGWAALLVADATAALALADEAAALALEGYGANLSPLDARVAAARPAPGQEEASARLRALLAGSRLETPGNSRRLQDPLSFRCLPSVHGGALAALAAARETVGIELRASGDNPLVLDEGTILPTGNFHAGALALAVSGLALALHGVAVASARRVSHLFDERSSALPRGLSAAPGTTVGLAALSKSTAGLVMEIRRLATPAYLDAIDAAEGVEDLAAPALIAVGDTAAIVERLRLLSAIELLVAAQAVDVRGSVDGLGERTAALHALVREHVAVLEEDRPIGPEVDRLAGVLAAR